MRIAKISHLSYEGKLDILGIMSLKDRYLMLHLIQTYKILHGFDSVDYKKYFTLNQNSNRSNGYKLMSKHIMVVYWATSSHIEW